jgi:hypothetical protein
MKILPWRVSPTRRSQGLVFCLLLIISPFVQMVSVCYFSDSIESLVYFSFLLYSITIK